MRTVVTVLAAVVMAVPGFAQDGQPAGGGVVVASSQSDRPAVLEALRARGARTTALGVRGGLTGWYVDLGSGDAYSLYLTADGHAVAGLLYGPDGSLLTGAQLAAAKVELRPSASVGGGASQGADGRLHTGGDRRVSERDLFDRSGEAFGFTVGEAGPVVVVFGDPGCPYSRAAAARLARVALGGGVRLRVVPVGVLGEASARAAAVIASSRDPAIAWFGGHERTVSAAGGRLIAANNKIYDEWGESSVPLIAWLSPAGRVVSRVGDIEDAAEWVRREVSR